MNITDAVLKRLVGIECPTGDIGDRVLNVLMENNSSLDRRDVFIERSEEYDKGDLKAYKAYGYGAGGSSIIVYVTEGLDHYVAKIVDASIH